LVSLHKFLATIDQGSIRSGIDPVCGAARAIAQKAW
jgi:hypothetical protein